MSVLKPSSGVVDSNTEGMIIEKINSVLPALDQAYNNLIADKISILEETQATLQSKIEF